MRRRLGRHDLDYVVVIKILPGNVLTQTALGGLTTGISYHIISYRSP